MKSPIKWAGGKSKLIPHIKELIKDLKIKRYVDLFSGSLAIPLEINFKKYVLNDINFIVINLYKIIKSNINELIILLEDLNKKENNNKIKFQEIKDEFNILKFKKNLKIKDKIRLAGIFIYLNKRSFNGLYRENKKGIYNVPYRENKSNIFDKELFINLSKYFNNNNIIFTNYSFEDFDISCFKKNDLVYLDPPYYPSKKSKFTSYSKEGFTIKQQEKIAELCNELNNKNIKFILSNSPCSEIENLYKKYNQKKIYIGRQMRSSQGKSDVYQSKNEPNEILIWNF